VFLWEVSPSGKKDALDRLAKSIGKKLDRIDRTHRDGRHGICVVAESTEMALATGLAAVGKARQEKLAVRVICDLGLVLGGTLKPDKKLIARLQSADDLPGLPLDCVLATEAYAAQAKFDLGQDILLTPVGRAEAYLGSDDGERQTVRSRPSLPIYTARWTPTRP
jgi:hypothetical protein